MKLQDLEMIKKTQDKVSHVLESRLGRNVPFRQLSVAETGHMLKRVRRTLSEHRARPDFHRSESNPAYLKLVMLEQGLASQLSEMNDTVMLPIDTKDPKIQQTLKKAEQGQTLSPDEQKTISAIATQKKESQKNKRMVKESEVQQAQVVLAAQDMLDRVQGMLEDISEMQFKDLPSLVNSIKNDIGTDQAAAFQQDASAALSTLLTAVESAKTAMESAQGTLTGQEPVVPGEPNDLDLEADTDDDLDLDIDIDADMPPREEEDDDNDESSNLGRERR